MEVPMGGNWKYIFPNGSLGMGLGTDFEKVPWDLSRPNLDYYKLSVEMFKGRVGLTNRDPAQNPDPTRPAKK